MKFAENRHFIDFLVPMSSWSRELALDDTTTCLNPAVDVCDGESGRWKNRRVTYRSGFCFFSLDEILFISFFLSHRITHVNEHIPISNAPTVAMVPT